MIDRPMPPRQAVETLIKSPLDEELKRMEKTHRLYQKYNIRRKNDFQMPETIWEGEDKS